MILDILLTKEFIKWYLGRFQPRRHEFGAEAASSSGKLPLPALASRAPRRWCNFENHCAYNMDAIRLRQMTRSILLAKRSPAAEIRLNQTALSIGSGLHPNIVIWDTTSQTKVIADLAITFEDKSAGARLVAAKL
ncbi:unnamed protein product [Peronospora belbahrii]|uniref:Uncharacterized protein n=1 Tax=Peronospora belbahrii TaxID=622444 RepID=A0AAU9L1I1_9STRA|nr:unnamed protein product [Peronospora belbahrii]CAH0521342.1 unnamed protein product [Peronospora belbahrii]